jgi:hypothetical protein
MDRGVGVVVVEEQAGEIEHEQDHEDGRDEGDDDAPGRPSLHLDGAGSLWEQANELAVEIASFRSQRPAELRRQSQPMGGRKCF